MKCLIIDIKEDDDTSWQGNDEELDSCYLLDALEERRHRRDPWNEVVRFMALVLLPSSTQPGVYVRIGLADLAPRYWESVVSGSGLEAEIVSVV